MAKERRREKKKTIQKGKRKKNKGRRLNVSPKEKTN